MQQMVTKSSVPSIVTGLETEMWGQNFILDIARRGQESPLSCGVMVRHAQQLPAPCAQRV